MSGLELLIAAYAYDCHPVELTECFGLVLFAQEHFLTILAPGLQIVRIIAVLDKTNRHDFGIDHVAADDRGDAGVAVCVAVDGQWVIVQHGCTV